MGEQDVVTTRFINCHNYLVENNVVKSSRQFAISLDYLPQSLSEILRGRRNVTIELLRKAIQKYRFNPNYVFHGLGSLIETGSDTNSNDVLVVLADDEQNERIVHVPYPAHAGYGGQLHDPHFIKELPSFTLPDPYFQTGTFRAFDISGDSMEPTLYEGETVVCSYVDKESWKYDLRNGYVYVFITQGDIVVKRVQNNIRKDGTITLISDNEFYPERVLPISEVLEVWFLKMKISPFMASPNNIRNALHKEVDTLRSTLKAQNKSIQEMNSTINMLLKQLRERK